MKKLLFILLMFSFDVAQAGFESSVLLEFGQGEFENKHQTKKQIITANIDIGRYHLSSKTINNESDAGPIDDNEFSLIDSKEQFLGVGIHGSNYSDYRYEGTLYFSDKYYLADLTAQKKIWGGLGFIGGINHRNRYSKGRKTTGAKVGLYYQPLKNYQLSVTYNIRNNTIDKVDDYLLFGLRRGF